MHARAPHARTPLVLIHATLQITANCLFKILGTELYDHTGDPGELDWAGEHVNVAGDSDNTATVKQLHALVLNYIQLK